MSQNTTNIITEPIAIVGMDTGFENLDGIDALFQAIYTGRLPDPAWVQTQAFSLEMVQDKIVERVLSQAQNAQTNPGIVTAFSEDFKPAGNRSGRALTIVQNAKGPVVDLSGHAFPFLAMIQQAQQWLANGKAQSVLMFGANRLSGNRNGGSPVTASPGLGFNQSIHDWTQGAGAAAVVLKRAADAREDGDTIYALIKAAGADLGNNPKDDHKNSNGVAVESIQNSAIAAIGGAGITIDEIGYLEAFGCGKDSLDQAEIDGLCRAYPGQNLSVALGSIQSLVGYTGAAASLAALVKTALCVYHRILPASSGWTAPKSPELWAGSRFYVPTEGTTWFLPAVKSARYAALSAINPGGGSAHLILEEDNRPVERPNPLLSQTPFYLFLVSGHDQAALLDALAKLKSTLESAPAFPSLAVETYQAFSQQQARSFTAVLVAHHPSELRRELEMAVKGIPIAFSKAGEWQTPNGSYFTANPQGATGKLAFVYPGAFNSYPGMGRDLFALFPHLHEKMSEVTRDIGDKLREHMVYPRGLAKISDDDLKMIEYSLQSDAIAMLITGSGMAFLYTAVLRDVFDVHPSAAFGYSLGEFAMGFATGVWTNADDCTARLESSFVFRNRLAGPQNAVREAWGLPQEQTATPTPLWVNYVLMTTPDAVISQIQPGQKVYLTHINTPRQVVIGGDPAACQRVIAALRCSSLQAPFNYALHCDAIRSEYDGLAYLHTWPVSTIPEMALYSAAGYAPAVIEEKALGQGIGHALVNLLDFPKLIQRVYQDGARVFIELGAGSNCTRWVDETLKDQPHAALGINRRGADDHTSILRALARLVSHGIHANLTPLYHLADDQPRITNPIEEDWQAWQ